MNQHFLQNTQGLHFRTIALTACFQKSQMQVQTHKRSYTTFQNQSGSSSPLETLPQDRCRLLLLRLCCMAKGNISLNFHGRHLSLGVNATSALRREFSCIVEHQNVQAIEDTQVLMISLLQFFATNLHCIRMILLCSLFFKSLFRLLCFPSAPQSPTSLYSCIML